MAGHEVAEPAFWAEERAVLAPPANVTVSEWAERNRMIVVGPRPGLWSNDLTPFLREIMDTYNDEEVREVTVIKGAQIGGTDSLLNIVGYVIDHEPDWLLYVMPRDEDWKHICADRVKPMVMHSEALLRHVTDSPADLKQGSLRFDRASIFFASSNTPAGLASKPCRTVICDEVDKYPAWSAREADPISLAKARTKTYANRKVYKISTPTTRAGAIYREWEKSDKRRFHIPCPSCGVYQSLVWAQVRFPPDLRDPDLLRTDPRVSYHCTSCDSPISDKQKRAALRRGVWAPDGATVTTGGEVLGARKTAHRGYHVTGLLSPFTSWGELVADWVQKSKTAQGLLDFFNSVLGEPFEQQSESTDPQYLEGLKQDYPSGTVPDAALWLTAGVDVQDRLLYYTIRAWGIGLDSWLVRAGRVDTWEALENVLFATRYQKGNGRDELVVRKMCIDTQGHRTSEVHAWCRKWDGIATPVKGAARLNGEPYRPFRVERTEDGKPVGGMAWHVDTSYFKDTLHRLIHTQPGDKGFWALHGQATQEYMAQVSAEHRIAVTNKRTKRIDMAWTTKPGGGENHWLDCEVYALVAADMLGIHQVNAQDVASAGAKAGAGKSIRDHMPASHRAFGRPARRGFGP